MSTIRICDSCKKTITSLESVSFWGSSNLKDIIFCENCFKEVEKFVMDKYMLKDHESITQLESSQKF